MPFQPFLMQARTSMFLFSSNLGHGQYHFSSFILARATLKYMGFSCRGRWAPQLAAQKGYWHERHTVALRSRNSIKGGLLSHTGQTLYSCEFLLVLCCSVPRPTSSFCSASSQFWVCKSPLAFTGGGVAPWLALLVQSAHTHSLNFNLVFWNPGGRSVTRHWLHGG